MRPASTAIVASASANSSRVMPAVIRTAPRWWRCNLDASSCSNGWCGSVATPSMINCRRATPMDSVDRLASSPHSFAITESTAARSSGCPAG